MKRVHILMFIISLLLLCSCTGKVDNKDDEKDYEDEDIPVNEVIDKDEEQEDDLLLSIREKIGNEIDYFTFNIMGNSETNVVKSILVYDSNDELLQELIVDDSIGFGSEFDYGVAIGDYNFDGYKDIKVQRRGASGANTLFSFWLWSSATSSYNYNQKLSELTSVQVDEKNKLIISINSSSAGANYVESVYEYDNGKLRMIKEMRRVWNEEKQIFKYMFYELQDDLMVQVDEIEVSPEESYDLEYEWFARNNEKSNQGNTKKSSFFFERGVSRVGYSAAYMFNDFVEKDTDVLVNKLAKNESGEFYELVIEETEKIDGMTPDRLVLGYFYVEGDKIYKIEPTKENRDLIINKKVLPGDNILVCQQEELNDPLSEEEPGLHYYIVVDGDKREFHSYNSQTGTGYYESFIWQEGIGLIYYESGFGAQRDAIELQMLEW